MVKVGSEYEVPGCNRGKISCSSFPVFIGAVGGGSLRSFT